MRIVSVLLALALASPAAAFELDRVVVRDGSVSPDGRFVVLRMDRSESGSQPTTLLLVDVEAGTRRPITHAVERSIASPDGAMIAFVTDWGTFVATRGSPAVGTLLHVSPDPAGVVDLCWRDAAKVRTLGTCSTVVDLTQSAATALPWKNGDRSLDERCEASSAPPSRPARVGEPPIVLRDAILLGWSREGRLILRARDGGPFWLIDPATGDVRLQERHPGAVRNPILELRRRLVGGSEWECEIWLHDGRPGGRARLVLPVREWPRHSGTTQPGDVRDRPRPPAAGDAWTHRLAEPPP